MTPTLAIVLVVAMLAVAAGLLYKLGGAEETPDRAELRASGQLPSAASVAGRKYNWLLGDSAEVEGKCFHVGKRTATIGRGMGNFVQIVDTNASRVHAQFVGSAAGLKFKDMTSSNGTTLNGEPVEADEYIRLEDGDRIGIGDTYFVYYREGDFRDDALTGLRDVHAARQKQTFAMGSASGGDLKGQIIDAVQRAEGDFEAAARETGLDPGFIQFVFEQEQKAGD